MRITAIPAVALCLVLTIQIVQSCKVISPAAETTSTTTTNTSVTYANDLLPIMQRSCTPCHFPQQGQKKMLNTYQATKENAKEILTRIQLPVDNLDFMPFKSKRTPLTDQEIKMFEDWVANGMPQ